MNAPDNPPTPLTSTKTKWIAWELFYWPQFGKHNGTHTLQHANTDSGDNDSAFFSLPQASLMQDRTIILANSWHPYLTQHINTVLYT